MGVLRFPWAPPTDPLFIVTARSRFVYFLSTPALASAVENSRAVRRRSLKKAARDRIDEWYGREPPRSWVLGGRPKLWKRCMTLAVRKRRRWKMRHASLGGRLRAGNGRARPLGGAIRGAFSRRQPQSFTRVREVLAPGVVLPIRPNFTALTGRRGNSVELPDVHGRDALLRGADCRISLGKTRL